MQNQKIVVYAALIAAMIFWSISFVWTKSLLSQMGPVLLIGIRLSLASLFLLSLGYGLRMHQRMKRADYKYMLLLAVFNPFLYFIGENFGMLYVSPTVAAVMIATIPLFTPLAAFITQGERLSANGYLGILLSMVGVALVAIQPEADMQFSAAGISFLLMAVLAAVVYTLLIHKMSGRYNALSLTVHQNWIGLLLFLPLWLILEADEISSIQFSINMLWPLLGLSVLCSSLAFVFFAYGIQKIGASLANSFSNIIPVFTAIFSYLVLGETLTAAQLGGIALVIAGLFVSQYKAKTTLDS